MGGLTIKTLFVKTLVKELQKPIV